LTGSTFGIFPPNPALAANACRWLAPCTTASKRKSMRKLALSIALIFLVSCQNAPVINSTITPVSTNTIIPATATNTVLPTSTSNPVPTQVSIYASFDGKEWGKGNIDFTCYHADIENIQKSELSPSDNFSVLRWTTCYIKDSVTNKDTKIIVPITSYNSETEYLAFAFTINSGPMPKHNLNDEFIDVHLPKVLNAVQASGQIDIVITTGNNSSALLQIWNPYEKILSPENWGDLMFQFGKNGDTSKLPSINGLPIVIPYRVSVAE
jgi:hypothetical protein